MKNRLDISHPNIIDYAFHSDKCDLLDVWLFANCDLCASTGSGPDTISASYRRPLLMTNFCPFFGVFSWAWTDGHFLPRPLRWKSNGVLLSFKDHLDHAFGKTEDYEKAGIEIVDLDSEIILEAVQKRWKYLNGSAVEIESYDSEMQSKFRRQLEAWPEFSKYHRYIHPNFLISYSFLRKYPDFLGENYGSDNKLN